MPGMLTPAPSTQRMHGADVGGRVWLVRVLGSNNASSYRRDRSATAVARNAISRRTASVIVTGRAASPCVVTWPSGLRPPARNDHHPDRADRRFGANRERSCGAGRRAPVFEASRTSARRSTGHRAACARARGDNVTHNATITWTIGVSTGQLSVELHTESKGLDFINLVT
jgi:hypothetical protein